MPYVQAGEVRLHYVEHGSGPEPLVFIHGFTSSTNAWSETLPRLPQRYHAYALDLRGAGESDKPESGYGLQIYADEIHLATLALGLDTFTYIGHSMGGVTGMAFALRHPERLRKLMLVAPAPSGGITIDPTIAAQVRSMRTNREVRRGWAKALMVRPLRDELIELGIDEDLKWSEAAYDEAGRAMAELRISQELAEIKTPTLIVAGDRDFLRAANLEDAQRIPNCALHVFYRVGHNIPFDVPEEFVALLDDFIQHGTAPPSPFQRPVATPAGAKPAS